jgi:hypothetical protein
MLITSIPARFLEDKPKAEEPCKGRIYRAQVSSWANTHLLGARTRLSLLKRDSCPGCEKCGWLDEALEEVGSDWPIQNIDTVQDGKKYKLRACNFSYDYESGITDGYDLGLFEVE